MEDGSAPLYPKGLSLRDNPLCEGAIFHSFRTFTEKGCRNNLYLHRLGKRGRIYLSFGGLPMSGDSCGRKKSLD